MRDRYLKAKEVAEVLNVGTRTVYKWSKAPTGSFPKPLRLGDKGKTLRWKESEIPKYVEDHERDREEAEVGEVIRLAC